MVDKIPSAAGGNATAFFTIMILSKRGVLIMNIADRIQNLRKTKGISQEELADKVGVSRQAVSKWESEQSTPDIGKFIDHIWIMLADVLRNLYCGRFNPDKEGFCDMLALSSFNLACVVSR